MAVPAADKLFGYSGITNAWSVQTALGLTDADQVVVRYASAANPRKEVAIGRVATHLFAATCLALSARSPPTCAPRR